MPKVRWDEKKGKRQKKEVGSGTGAFHAAHVLKILLGAFHILELRAEKEQQQLLLPGGSPSRNRISTPSRRVMDTHQHADGDKNLPVEHHPRERRLELAQNFPALPGTARPEVKRERGGGREKERGRREGGKYGKRGGPEGVR